MKAYEKMETELKETIAFRVTESLKKEAETYADNMGISRSDFFRMCFQKGFEELSGISKNDNEVIISFPITKTQDLTAKSLQKHQPNQTRIHQTVYEAGLNVYKLLDDIKILSLTKHGIMPILESFKKIIDNKEAKQIIKSEVKKAI